MVTVLLVAAVTLVAVFVVMRWKEAVSTVRQVNSVSLEPDAFSVRATGWSDAELALILGHFAEAYKLSADTFDPVVEPGGAIRIQATKPVELYRLLFLINYLRYPIGFDPTGHAVGGVATITLDQAMGAPPEFAGRTATIYVPADDTEFDVVYVRVEPASYFEISFADMQWAKADDGREPDEVSRLTRTSN